MRSTQIQKKEADSPILIIVIHISPYSNCSTLEVILNNIANFFTKPFMPGLIQIPQGPTFSTSSQNDPP